MRNLERYREAKRLRDSGMTLRQAGATMGVSAQSIRDMVTWIERWDAQCAREAANPSLIEWSRGLDNDTIWALRRLGIESRDGCQIFAGELVFHRRDVCLPGWEEYKDKEPREWDRCPNKIRLFHVNKIRVWLGVEPFIYVKPAPSAAYLERAKVMLERNGYRVERVST